MAKLAIGSVVFWKDGKPCDVVGPQRVEALRALYRGETIPGGLEPRSDYYNHSRPIIRHDVNWETAGKSVKS